MMNIDQFLIKNLFDHMNQFAHRPVLNQAKFFTRMLKPLALFIWIARAYALGDRSSGAIKMIRFLACHQRLIKFDFNPFAQIK